MTQKIVLKDVKTLTHDTYRYIFSRPEGMTFEPGQATHLAIDEDGWRDEDRAFTFTSQPEDSDLEFVIKSYPEHDGVTEQLPQLKPGATAIMEPPAGAIVDQGPGVFIAAGAGITPFIPIIRKRARDNEIDGCMLIFSNKTEADIIMRGEWEATQHLKTVFTLTDEKVDGLEHGLVDKAFLENHVEDLTQKFYICGPGDFVDDIRDALKDMGVSEDNIVTEDGW